MDAINRGFMRSQRDLRIRRPVRRRREVGFFTRQLHTRFAVYDLYRIFATNRPQTRDGTRERVTAVADHLSEEVERLNAELQAARLQLGIAEQGMEALQQENAELRGQLRRLGSPADQPFTAR